MQRLPSYDSKKEKEFASLLAEIKKQKLEKDKEMSPEQIAQLKALAYTGFDDKGQTFLYRVISEGMQGHRNALIPSWYKEGYLITRGELDKFRKNMSNVYDSGGEDYAFVLATVDKITDESKKNTGTLKPLGNSQAVEPDSKITPSPGKKV